MDIGPGELLLIALVIVLLFGAAKLPKLARSIGQAKSEFQRGLDEGSGSARDDRTHEG